MMSRTKEEKKGRSNHVNFMQEEDAHMETDAISPMITPMITHQEKEADQM